MILLTNSLSNDEMTKLGNHRDYAQNGWYFVTIGTHQKINYFGHIINGQMQRSPIGEMAEKYWLEIPRHHQHISIDQFIIMPKSCSWNYYY